MLASYAKWYSFTPPQRPNFPPPLTCRTGWRNGWAAWAVIRPGFLGAYGAADPAPTVVGGVLNASISTWLARFDPFCPPRIPPGPIQPPRWLSLCRRSCSCRLRSYPPFPEPPDSSLMRCGHSDIAIIPYQEYHRSMVWEVEVTDQFKEWWHTLDEEQQDAVAIKVTLL